MPKNRQNKTKKSKTDALSKTSDPHRIRVRLIAIAMLGAFSVIGIRLVQFQIDPDMRFSDEVLKHIGRKLVERPRGTIFDVNSRPLATNRQVPSLSVNPERVENPEKLAVYLSQRMELSYEDLYERVTRTNAKGKPMQLVWLKRRMSKEEFERIGEIEDSPEPEALLMQHEAIRFYPEKDLASQVLGFSNLDGIGIEGIEKKFDSHLFSEAGEMRMRVDNNGRRAIAAGTYRRAPTGGDDITLTINAQLQYTLEQELDKAMLEHKAERSMGLLMDPDTGAILAMATRPAFDPNEYGTSKEEHRLNSAVTDFFEPGSSFKIVTAAAALELGLVTTETPIDCMNGLFRPYGRRLIHDTHKLGVTPFGETFVQSSNIAIIKVADLLGPERLESWIRRFGFGAKTGLEVPLESAGFFRRRENWSGYSMSSLPMGQEISVTLPQLAQAFSVIANGGHTVKPHLVKEIRNQDGALTYRFEEGERHRVISSATAETMRNLAYRVVSSEHGTAKRAAIREYRAGGKTGTAEIAKKGGGGYSDDRYTTVFAGFAPIADPKITCVIVVHEPMITNHFGGFVCAPVFQKVVREALVNLNVPKDPMEDQSFFERNRNLFAKEDNDEDTVVFLDELEVFEPSMSEESFDSLELVSVSTDKNGKGPRLPNFKKLTKRQAKLMALELGIEWDPQGAGRVVSQDPAEGTLLADVQVCKLVFGHHIDSDEAS